jgi:hypothetical protein
LSLEGFTSTEQRILAVLGDGERHRQSELQAVLDDELASKGSVFTHLSRIRVKLRPIGQDIICEFNNRRIFYRWIRRIDRSE